MNIEEIMPKLMDFNTELTNDDRASIAEKLMEAFGVYRQLLSEDYVTIGDYVKSEGTTPSGYRLYNGFANIQAENFTYPIYRRELPTQDCE